MSGEFELGGIVAWGRTAAEYEAFFGLSGGGPGLRVLDCGGGPASFATEWGRLGHFAVSVDPLYARPMGAIAADFDSIAQRMRDGMCRARERFRWEYYGTPEAVIGRRRAALKAFLNDRIGGAPTGRYVAGRLPVLPFTSDSFDLVLCSHLLFLYSEELSLDAHLAALTEMLRVGREVRVFPLIDLHGRPSRHLDPVLEHFGPRVRCELVPVNFEFQAGANRMLRLARAITLPR